MRGDSQSSSGKPRLSGVQSNQPRVEKVFRSKGGRILLSLVIHHRFPCSRLWGTIKVTANLTNNTYVRRIPSFKDRDHPLSPVNWSIAFFYTESPRGYPWNLLLVAPFTSTTFTKGIPKNSVETRVLKFLLFSRQSNKRILIPYLSWNFHRGNIRWARILFSIWRLIRLCVNNIFQHDCYDAKWKISCKCFVLSFFFQYNIVGITYIFVMFYSSEPFSSQTNGYYYVNIIIKLTFSKYIFCEQRNNIQYKKYCLIYKWYGVKHILHKRYNITQSIALI